VAFVYQPRELKINEKNLKLSQNENVLFVGTASGFTDLDPLYTYRLGSFDVIDQIAEGLFGFDYSDPNLAIVPQLAVDHGIWNGNLYTVELRQDVEFHDETHFDAYAVKFTFDRLQYFMDNGMLLTENLYKYYDYLTDEMIPIINAVNVVSEYLVEFELNIQYGLFETLLAFESSFILSPTSTPLEDIIDVYSGPIIGTGPFVFEYYDGMVTSFSAFDNYWNGRPEIDHLLFKYIYDGNEQADLLASGELHMILDPPTFRRGEFEGDPAYVLDSIGSTMTMFIVMNNHFIDRDLREAISYAIDYEYLMNDIYGGECTRLKSPIPNGIAFSDDSFNVPTTDIIHARTVMQSMGLGAGLNLYDDSVWEASTFLSLNYTYNIGSQIREDIYYLLVDNLGKIGIDVQEAAVEYWEFESKFQDYEPYNRDMLQLYWLGWAADYNDPSDYINNLYTNRTSTLARYNGFNAAVEAGRNPYILEDNVQLLMEAALIETDHSLRVQYYSRIQQLLVEEDFPYAFGYVPMNHIWYNSEIQGFQMNSMRKLNFLGVTGVSHEEVDTTPPVTYISNLDGVWGWNGWFQSDVLVTLDAYDDLSGVYMIGFSFDGVNWTLYTEEILITESKTLYYASVDYNGNYEIPNSVDILIDKIPPVTQAIISGEEGLNGWFTSEVLVTLVATDDNSGVAGSGYSFDLITTIPYTGPFTLIESKIFGYGSADNAGNYDNPQIAEVKIDTIHPETTCVITGAQGTGDWYISDVMLELNAFDADSGVDNIEYSIDGSTWNDYTDPLILIESGNYEFYFRSSDIAGNIEPVLVVVFEIDKSPSAITEKIIQDLQTLDVPHHAQKDVNKALIALQKALDQFNEDRFYLGLLKIHKAIIHLMDAQDDGANVQSNIKNTINMVQELVEAAIKVAIGLVGENNRFVIKAVKNFDKALLKVSEGQYEKAMIYFKNVYLKISLINCLYKIFMNNF
jgi:peptide/nickel transport system substrate-binding protein